MPASDMTADHDGCRVLTSVASHSLPVMASQQQSRRHQEEEDSISTRSPQLLQPANVGDLCAAFLA